MKTREEVEALKRNWLEDPCWDIEDTEGFEEYAVELRGYHVEWRSRWEAAREKEEAARYRNTPASEAMLRDVIAAHAMEGDLASQSTDAEWSRDTFPALAERAYRIADAMMAERKVKP